MKKGGLAPAIFFLLASDKEAERFDFKIFNSAKQRGGGQPPSLT